MSAATSREEIIEVIGADAGCPPHRGYLGDSEL